MIGDVLRHPLTVLFIGALVTGLLVPRITRQWQDQRKALELKAELVERLTLAVTAIFTAVQFVQVGAQSQTMEQFDQAYRSWQQEKAILTSLLKAYFRNDAIDAQWRKCRALATAYYVQSGIADAERRKTYLETVAAGLAASPEPRDLSEEVRDERAVQMSAGGQSTELPLTDVAALRDRIRNELDATVQLVIDTPAVAAG